MHKQYIIDHFSDCWIGCCLNGCAPLPTTHVQVLRASAACLTACLTSSTPISGREPIDLPVPGSCGAEGAIHQLLSSFEGTEEGADDSLMTSKVSVAVPFVH